MGDNTDIASLGLLPVHDFGNAGIRFWNMVFHIVQPEVGFRFQVTVCHAVFINAHFNKTRLKILQKVIFQRAGSARKVFPQKGEECRMMDGGSTVNGSVVMVKDQAPVTHCDSFR